MIRFFEHEEESDDEFPENSREPIKDRISRDFDDKWDDIRNGINAKNIKARMEKIYDFPGHLTKFGVPDDQIPFLIDLMSSFVAYSGYRTWCDDALSRPQAYEEIEAEGIKNEIDPKLLSEAVGCEPSRYEAIRFLERDELYDFVIADLPADGGEPVIWTDLKSPGQVVQCLVRALAKAYEERGRDG